MGKIVIKQAGGLGDIFFLQKLGHKLAMEHEEVIWPIGDYFGFLKDYLIYPNIKYVKESDFLNNNYPCVDFSGSNIKYEGGSMISKYKSVGIDHSDWAKYFLFQRNRDKESQLFKDLGLATKKYTIVSNTWGSYPFSVKRDVNIHQEADRIINIDFIKNYTVFDWCQVLENAEAIHMIDTCFLFIIEKLNLKTKNLFVYSRHTPPNFGDFDNLFTQPWQKVFH
jgi:hypothetical protein